MFERLLACWCVQAWYYMRLLQMSANEQVEKRAAADPVNQRVSEGHAGVLTYAQAEQKE